MLKPTIFREYDIRGIADTELLSADTKQLGRGLATYIRRHRSGNPTSPARDDAAAQLHVYRRVSIVADAGNGNAGPVMHRIFEKLNVEAKELFFDMDGSFPNHHPAPTVPATLKYLANAVREKRAEMGIAFDGDADRIGAIDENGNVVYGDMLMLIYGREILTRKPGATFIGEVKCSQILYDELKK